MRLEEDNGRAMGMVKGNASKIRRFSSNEFWKNIGCLILDPTFGLGGLRLWEKEEAQKIIGNKRKIRSIRVKFYLYKVCVYSILFVLFFII